MIAASPIAGPLASTSNARNPASRPTSAPARDATQPTLPYCCSSLRRRS